MGADILQYVEKHVGNPMVCDHIIAEIVRLRGEVAPNVAGLVDSLIQLRDADWTLNNEPMPDDAQGVLNMAIEAIRNPAPAMPNGVERLVAEWEALIAHPDTSTIMRTTLENVVTRLRAADNRDAAGVAEEYDEGPTWTHDGKRISAVFSGDGKVGLVITANPGAVNGRIEFIGAPVPIPITPAAVPAGEANADAPAGVLEHLIFSVDRIANSGDYGLCDQAVVQLNYAIEDARRGIGTGAQQPANGEAVAPLGYVRRKAISAMREDDEVTGIMVHVDAPSDSVPVYLHPPAPVQATPQEGEAVAIVGPGGYPQWLVSWLESRPGGRALPRNTLLYAHPSACELGAVRELVKVWRIAVNSASTTNKQDLRPERFIRELEAALQHRGDSRGGEG